MNNKIIILGFLLSFFGMNAQVGIGTTTPSSAAVLHLSTQNFSTTNRGGFLMPVVTEVQQGLIPVTIVDDGLMVFVSDSGTGKWCWDIYDAEGNSGAGIWRSIKCNTPMVAVCDTQIYSEDFSSYANESGIKDGNNNADYPAMTSWVLTGGAGIASGDYAMVNGDVFELNDTNGTVIFTTPAIDINGYATICFSVDIAGSGPLEYDLTKHNTDDTNTVNDYVNIEYSTDNGTTWTFIYDYNGNGTVHHTLVAPPPPPPGAGNVFPDSTVSVSGLSGTFLKIRITGQNWAGNEYLTYDNIIIEGGN